MKKLILTFLGILLLAGCTDDKEKNSEEPEADLNTELESTEATNEDVVVEDASDNKELESFAEFTILKENINVDSLAAVVESDNQGNRVILFVNDKGLKEYKSIFIKHENRLKIIKLDDDSLVFNKIFK